jgi:hypothetical protein
MNNRKYNEIGEDEFINLVKTLYCNCVRTGCDYKIVKGESWDAWRW